MNRSPSLAHLWGNCALSATFELSNDASGVAKAEGTAVHELGAAYIQGRTLGDVASNGVRFTEEMRDNALEYARLVTSAPAGEAGVRVEQKLTAKEIHETCRGFVDAFALNWDTRTAYVWDYKNGYVPVRAFENLQLVCYFQMLIEEYELGPDWKLVGTIVQPHDFRKDIKTWETTAGDLAHHVSLLQRAAEAGDRTHPPATTGPHCKTCGGRASCEALRAAAGTAVDWSLTDDAVELDDVTLGIELRMMRAALDRLKHRVEGLEVTTEERIRRGRNVAGFTLKFSKGHERWLIDKDEVMALGEKFGVETYKRVALTPKQSREAGVDADVVKALSTRPSALKLTAIDAFEEKE